MNKATIDTDRSPLWLELVALIAKRCPRLYLWTHYYDKGICTSTPKLAKRFAHEGRSSREAGIWVCIAAVIAQPV